MNGIPKSSSSCRLFQKMDLLITMWALKVAHVFNDTDNCTLETVEHSDRLDCNIHCDILGSGDYEDTRYRYRLGNSQRCVACAGRQIDYQIIQLSRSSRLSEIAWRYQKRSGPCKCRPAATARRKTHWNDLDALDLREPGSYYWLLLAMPWARALEERLGHKYQHQAVQPFSIG